MSIVPQRRTSKTRKRKRRTHFKLEVPGMMVCPNCGEMKLAHVVCGSCYYYDGKQIKEPKVKDTVEEVAKETPKKEKAPKVVKETPDKKTKVEQKKLAPKKVVKTTGDK